MKIDQRISSKTIVLTAQTFNPSVLGEQWLVKNGILHENELKGNFAFSNQVVQYTTESYSLTALQAQIQIAIFGEKEKEIIDNTLIKIINLLPHVPYKAIGINFNWELHPENGDDRKLSKLLFHSSNSPVFSTLESDEPYFGGYISKNFLSARMKLDMKPTHFNAPDGELLKWINFAFNYHCDLNGEVIDKANNFLTDWSKYFQDSKEILIKIVKHATN